MMKRLLNVGDMVTVVVNGMEITLGIIFITPSMAEEWLKKYNTHNRKLAIPSLRAYVREMLNGFWLFSHQGVAFDSNGVLLDGQTRLKSIADSGKGQYMLVVRGLHPDTQAVIDGQRVRSIGDNLHLQDNLSHSGMMAAIANGIIFIIKNYSFKGSYSIAKQVLDLYDIETISIMDNYKYAYKLSGAMVMSCFVMAAKCYPDETVDFEQKYFSGQNLEEGSPVLALRNYFLSRGALTNNMGTRRNSIRVTFTALMYFIQGKPLKILKTSDQGKDWFLNQQPGMINQIEKMMEGND